MSAPPTKTRACDYCGLPVPGRGAKNDASPSPEYCCYGCRFAAAVAQERGEVGQLRWNLTGLGLAIFFSMNVMVFTLVLWSLDLYPDSAGADQTQAALLWDLFRYLCLLFSLPVLLLLGRPLLENALGELRRGNFGVDVLLIAGVAAAYVYSAISVYHARGHVYFEVGCMILVAVTLGRWLEATGKWKATDALKSLAKLLPAEVDVMVDGRRQSRPLKEVRPGELIRVLAGQRIAVDGAIVEGESLIDEQIVTGESQPVAKRPGAAVYGGALNLDGNLLIEATAAADGGSLQRLIDAVAAAAAAPDRWRRLADRVSAVFTPAVLAVAVATLAAHWWLADFQHGLLAGLAVLLIACPCALGVATPLATWAALGAASRRGVLLHDGDALARLASVDTICFDKTGTLTDSRLQVDRLIVERDVERDVEHGIEHDGQPNSERDSVAAIAAALSDASPHVVSQAIRSFLLSSSPWPLSIGEVRNEPGLGVIADCDELGGAVLLGSERFMRQRGLQFGERLLSVLDSDEHTARSRSFVGWDGQVRGVFLFRETLRGGAAASLNELQSLGIRAVMLTGDRQARAEPLAGELGIDFAAELLPEEKLAAIERLRASGRRVAMIGDGVNDAPALAAADVGLALGCGADVSREAADVCLLRDDLGVLPWAIELSRAAQRSIRGNLAWAFGYNTVGIVLAAAGWLNPMLAALAMAGSSLLVVSNSLRLAARNDGDRSPLRSADDAIYRVANPAAAAAQCEQAPPSRKQLAEGAIA